jgi:hypothetical protein
MATKDKAALLIERVNLRSLAISLLIVAVGFLLIYCSEDGEWWKDHDVIQGTLREVGKLLLATGILVTAWDLYGKRAFLDEILAKAQIASEIRNAGLLKITDTFHSDIDWGSYFQTVRHLDIFLAYGRTWRNTHIQQLQSVAARRGSRIRIVLPDPNDGETVAELSRRFNKTPAYINDAIRETEQFFKDLRRNAHTNDPQAAEIEIWFLSAGPQYSSYRFDDLAILALYNHSKDRDPVPTFICARGGTLYDFVRREFRSMTEGGLAKAFSIDQNHINGEQ